MTTSHPVDPQYADFSALEKRIQGIPVGELLVYGGSKTGRMTFNMPKARPAGPKAMYLSTDYDLLKRKDD